MELQGTSTTAHRPQRRIQPILTATFGLIHGFDPGSYNRATTAAITVPTIQLHRGPQQHHQSPTTTGDGQAGRDATQRWATRASVILSDGCCPALPHPFGNGVGATPNLPRYSSVPAGGIKQLISPPKSWPFLKEYTRYSLSRGPGGSAPPSAWKRARLGPTTNTLGLTAHLRVAYWASYPKT